MSDDDIKTESRTDGDDADLRVSKVVDTVTLIVAHYT